MPRSIGQRAPMFSAPWYLLAGFVVAVLAVLVISFVNYRSSQARSVAVEDMESSAQAIRSINDLLIGVKDAETGQRGYLLTGDPAYLEPYHSAVGTLGQRLETLKNAVSRAAEDQEAAQRLRQLVQQKLDEMEQTIRLHDTNGAESAIARVRGNAGKDIMDSIREVAAQLMQRKEAQLTTRRQAWVDAASASTTSSLIGSGVLLLFIGMSAVVTLRTFRAKAEQGWIAAGLAGLTQELQGERHLSELGRRALQFLGDRMGIAVGAGYAVQAGKELVLMGGYALPRERLQETLLAGEGLVGQTVSAGRLLHVREVPEGHLPMTSATGQSRLTELIVAPAIEHGQVFAVFELGFQRPVTETERSFIEQAASVLAVAVRLGQDRQRLETLLEETKRQAEELQSQQEELRVSNEELEQQSRVLQASQAQMEVQQTELEQTNAHLEEQTQQLEYQREQLLKAQDALTGKARELEMASQYKSEFLANMSHELRTPLNSTLILAKLLSDNKPGNLNAEQVKYAQTITSAGNDLLALINDILDLSKIEAGQTNIAVEPVSVTKVVQSLVDPLRLQARDKGLTLTATVEDNVPTTIETDPLRLSQVLKNLLSNALKFTEHGTVSLHVSRGADDTLSFAVKDTGIGIPAHQQDLIFEAFRQADGSTHRKYGGTGLGLSISRDLAQLLGGQIVVRSTPGQGSVFTLTLPQRLVPEDGAPAPSATKNAPPPGAHIPTLSTPVPQSAAPSAAAPAIARAGARSILVIEDDERFARIMCDLASDMDFECHLAHNAADGLAMAKRLLPSAIVLDVNLPDFSGLGVLDQLKRNPATRHIPVHIVSVADHAQEAMGRGAVGYALKPIKLDALAQALQRLEAKFMQDMRRVLVVEDDERQRESVRDLLRSEDVEITCVGTATEALERLRDTTFDCMVMDLNLPDLSGFDLLEQMSAQEGASFPPVIVYTGRALSRDEEQQLRRFSKSIIIKDARSPERLLDEVTLFLHQVESELSPEHQRMLETARSRDSTLEGRTVLVVEDDVRNVFALSSILESTGIKLEIARNGREALEALARADDGGQPPIDLVLMDIMMPEMDGYTAMREIRTRPEWRRVPIIALTAKAMKDDQEKCLAAGANDYIAKPLDVEKLLSLVRVWMPK